MLKLLKAYASATFVLQTTVNVAGFLAYKILRQQLNAPAPYFKPNAE